MVRISQQRTYPPLPLLIICSLNAAQRGRAPAELVVAGSWVDHGRAVIRPDQFLGAFRKLLGQSGPRKDGEEPERGRESHGGRGRNCKVADESCKAPEPLGGEIARSQTSRRTGARYNYQVLGYDNVCLIPNYRFTC